MGWDVFRALVEGESVRRMAYRSLVASIYWWRLSRFIIDRAIETILQLALWRSVLPKLPA